MSDGANGFLEEESEKILRVGVFIAFQSVLGLFRGESKLSDQIAVGIP